MVNNKKLTVCVVILLLAVSLNFGVQVHMLETASSLGETNTPSTSTSSTDSWPMFRHDLNHTGYSTSNAPTTNHTLWTYTIGDEVHSSPTVVDGKVYVGSHDHNVYCFDAFTGAKLWNYTAGFWVHSSPAVADGKVYVGSSDYNVYCLNASTGARLWNHNTGYWVSSSPAVFAGKVYVGSNGGSVCCFDASTGAQLWGYATGLWVLSSPAVVDGKVYIGSHDGNVYCLNAFTGAKLWNYTTGDWVFSSPAVADGKVYVGSMDDNVYCLDASTGARLWNYTTGDNVTPSPAVFAGKVYVGSLDGSVYCLNASTGARLWSYMTGYSVQSSPAVAYGKVYVGSNDGSVYCFGFLKSDAAVTDVTSAKTVIGQGYGGNVAVTAQNLGDLTESFNVTIYANLTFTGALNFDLTSGSNASKLFVWNTTGFAYGNYTLKAATDIVPGETDIANNNYTCPIPVHVGVPGDFSGPTQGVYDGTCNMRDIQYMVLLFNTMPSSPNWKPNADVNNNGAVNMRDIQIAILNFGKHE